MADLIGANSDPADIILAPWDRVDWSGSFLTLDDTVAADFKLEDVSRVIGSYMTADNDWDGTDAAIVQLVDGRFAGWECSWGTSGDGFSDGDADVLFAATAEKILAEFSLESQEGLRG